MASGIPKTTISTSDSIVQSQSTRNDRPITTIFSSGNELKSRRHKYPKSLNVGIMVAGSPNWLQVAA
jgi:hypothetical protein